MVFLTRLQAQTNAAPTPAAILGALVSIGGIIGYSLVLPNPSAKTRSNIPSRRTGSIPSIAAGLSVGALYLYSYSLQKRQAPYGVELALLASVILGGSSIPRAIKTGKPVPQMLATLSLLGGGFYGWRWLNGR